MKIYEELDDLRKTGRIDVVKNFNDPIERELYFNKIDEQNYDKMNEIFMHPGFDATQPQKFPQPPSYPIFDETGKLLRPGDRGGQYNPLKHMNEMKNNEFNIGGGLHHQIKNNEIVRLNIEKLGGLESTIDSNLSYFIYIFK